MTMLKINSVFPLEGDFCNRYEGLAYDGRYFYLTVPKCSEVQRVDTTFCHVEKIKTCRDYTSISYDCELKVFWALSCDDRNRIYKVNEAWQEISSFEVAVGCEQPTVLTGISCGRKADKLLVAFACGIAEVAKTAGTPPRILQQATAGVKYLSVQGVSCGYLCGYLKNQRPGLVIYSWCNDRLFQCSMPKEYAAEDLAAACCLCVDECCQTVYLLATKKNCCPCIIECVLICDKPQPPKPQPPRDCCQGCAEIIESIALVETALAHILNAEGEKIQKALECAEQVSDLLEVNAAVNKTIINVTHLEQILYAKLEIVQQLYEECCKNPSPCQPCEPPCQPPMWEQE